MTMAAVYLDVSVNCQGVEPMRRGDRVGCRLWPEREGTGQVVRSKLMCGNRRGADLAPIDEDDRRCMAVIRKLKSGAYRLYSRKIDRKSGRRRNLGTFKTRSAAEKHERAVQFFKHGG
jgi:hypothetical protein